jgi:hypothetical protein
MRGRQKDNRRADGGVKPEAHLVTANKKATKAGTSIRRFVTFYFTNFPPQLSNFYLRKGFEVCGMLEDVVVSRRCNENGEHYGFVHYSNVRDVCKLLKAVNVVCFGHFQIKAKVATFDKSEATEVERVGEGVGGGELVCKVLEKAEGVAKTIEGVKKVSLGNEMEADTVEGDGDKSVKVGVAKGSSVVLSEVRA